jgi:hypothetical protein
MPDLSGIFDKIGETARTIQQVKLAKDELAKKQTVFDLEQKQKNLEINKMRALGLADEGYIQSQEKGLKLQSQMQNNAFEIMNHQLEQQNNAAKTQLQTVGAYTTGMIGGAKSALSEQAQEQPIGQSSGQVGLMTAPQQPGVVDYGGTKYRINPFTGKGEEVKVPPAQTTSDEEIQSTAQGVMNGNLAPDLAQVSSFRDRSRISSALNKDGFNLPAAQSEWKATQRFLNSMNSEKQTRLRQAIGSTRQALDHLKEINQEYSRSSLAPLNYLQLKAQANSGNELAVKYLGQLNIIQDELAQVFMGGNSPTEKALDLAKNMLSSNWSAGQLNASIDTIDKNLKYRENAINAAMPFTGGENRYYQGGNQQPTQQEQPQGQQTQQTNTSDNMVGKYKRLQ